MQYFCDLYQQCLGLDSPKDPKNAYVYCTEGMLSDFSDPKIERQLIESLLGSSELNKGIGKRFLQGPKDLFQDVLQEDAANHITDKKKKAICRL